MKNFHGEVVSTSHGYTAKRMVRVYDIVPKFAK
jgi:hypothetical protein